MAAPNHPAMALLCERLSKQATAAFDHHHHKLMGTLERTGPGLFTDVMNEWNNAGGHHDHWEPIVVLPIAAFGSGFGSTATSFYSTARLQKHSVRFNDLMRRDDVYVVHHFAGSWKPSTRKKGVATFSTGERLTPSSMSVRVNI